NDNVDINRGGLKRDDFEIVEEIVSLTSKQNVREAAQSTPATPSRRIQAASKSKKRKIATQRQGLLYLEEYDRNQNELKRREMELEERKLSSEERKLVLEEQKHRLTEEQAKKQLEIQEKMLYVLEKRTTADIEEHHALINIIKRQENCIESLLSKQP
ncbi:hypothetical protein NQ315_008288, partial [Exocentrus adspersus]